MINKMFRSSFYGYGLSGLLFLGLVVAYALIITLFVMLKEKDDKTRTNNKTLSDVSVLADEHSKHLAMLYSSPSALGLENVTISGNGKYTMFNNNLLYPQFDTGAVITPSASFPSSLELSIVNGSLNIHATDNVLYGLIFSLGTKIAASNNGLAYEVLELGIVGDNNIFQTSRNLGLDRHIGNYYSTAGKVQSFTGATFFNFVDGHDYHFVFITAGPNVNNTYTLTDPTNVVIQLLV